MKPSILKKTTLVNDVIQLVHQSRQFAYSAINFSVVMAYWKIGQCIVEEDYYMTECANQNWSTRTLERQIDTFTYERILSSKNKKKVKAAADRKAELPSELDFIKVPYLLEFLTHQDIGIKQSSDNPIIGIILCSQKNETIVKYSILKENKRLFASKYKLYLPSEAELKKELQTELKRYRANLRLSK
jgi:hypothetical protein